jgi:hypothetical protein
MTRSPEQLGEVRERVDLNDYEASKQKLAEIHQTEAEAKQEAEEQARKAAESAANSGTTGPRKSRRHDRPTGQPRGRPKGHQAGSRRDVAERTGMSPPEQRRTERHIELAERFPFLQGRRGLKHQAPRAGA